MSLVFRKLRFDFLSPTSPHESARVTDVFVFGGRPTHPAPGPRPGRPTCRSIPCAEPGSRSTVNLRLSVTALPPKVDGLTSLPIKPMTEWLHACTQSLRSTRALSSPSGKNSAMVRKQRGRDIEFRFRGGRVPCVNTSVPAGGEKSNPPAWIFETSRGRNESIRRRFKRLHRKGWTSAFTDPEG